jgi:hypothetical protein
MIGQVGLRIMKTQAQERRRKKVEVEEGVKSGEVVLGEEAKGEKRRGK